MYNLVLACPEVSANGSGVTVLVVLHCNNGGTHSS